MAVSMDGRQRRLDDAFVGRLRRSVKHGGMHARGYEAVLAPPPGPGRYFTFYNKERTHRSLGHWTPSAVHRGVKVTTA